MIIIASVVGCGILNDCDCWRRLGWGGILNDSDCWRR